MTSPGSANKTAIGVSWGADTGCVSNSIISNKQLQTCSMAEIIKVPSVLANADGNRAPSLWLNVANEEFLLSDGARSATLRFPQQGLRGIVNLLCPSTAKQTMKKPEGTEETDFRNLCLKKVRVYESEDDNNDEDDKDSEDEVTNFKPMTVHTDAKDSTLAALQGKFSVFLEKMKRDLKLDAEGLVPKTTFKIDGEDDEGKEIEEEAVRLPETTWECALAVARIFRTIINDSLTGASAASSPVSPAANNTAQFPTASTGLEMPTSIVVSIPRHRTNTQAAYSLLRLAWHDWCMKSPKNQFPSQLKIVHDDVAAFAAVLPKERLMNCANDKAGAGADLTTPHVALVVNWGATTLTVSLMLQICEPVNVMKSTDATTAEADADNNDNSVTKKSHPMMICLASKTIDREVGGYFIDQKVTDTELMMTAKRKRLPPVETSSRGYRKFLNAAERAKIVLSSSQTTSVEIEAAVEGMDFIEPSFTRSKLENVISSACRLPAKFNELVASLFAEYAADKKKFLPITSRSGKVNFGVVLSGGTLAIPYLQNLVKTQGTQALETFLEEQNETNQPKLEFVNAKYSFAGMEPQEICSMGACYLAQTGCAVDISAPFAGMNFPLSSEKKRNTTFAKPQLSLLSCDVLLMKKDDKKSGLAVFQSGSTIPCKREISGEISSAEYSGFLIVNKVNKTVVTVPFAAEAASEAMSLKCSISPCGVFKVVDTKKENAKVCEITLA